MGLAPTDVSYVALGDHNDQVFNDVSTVLWRERQLLELLVFKLDEEQLLLTAGKVRWVSSGTLGSLSQTVTQDQTNATNTVSDLQVQVGNISDASEDQVITELDLAETSYQAALQTTAKIIQPSLAQFLQ